MTKNLEKFLKPFTKLKIRRNALNRICIEEIVFEPMPLSERAAILEKLRTSASGICLGFIFDDLSNKTRSWLDKHQISYMTTSGYITIFLENNVISIRPEKRSSKPIISAVSKPTSRTVIKPSRLVNATAFQIFDVLVRMQRKELTNLSGLSLAKTYSLSQ